MNGESNESAWSSSTASMPQNPQFRPPVSNTYAWALALSPLIALPLGFALALTGLPDNVANYASLGLTIGLVTADRQLLLNANYTNPPSRWWILLSPVYLWKRATVLGESRRKFWVFIASIVGVFAVAIGMGALGDSSFAVKSCAASQQDAIRIFDSMAAVKQARITATSLSDITETGFDNKTRHCSGIITTSAGNKYSLNFDIYIQDNKTYIRERVGNPQ